MGKEQQQLEKLNTKFNDIEGLRERINADAETIATNLKQFYTKRKALSPAGMIKNIKSISSFLDNFSRMMQNLSTKLGSLTAQINEITGNIKKINAAATEIRK